MNAAIINIQNIYSSIYLIRNQKVMIDSDLARLYGVETKVLLQSIKRNNSRFPEDFMFQLKNQEFIALRSHFVTSNKSRGGRRYNPYVFTEQGIAMLSSVLNSKRAIQVNIEIMRAFVGLRKAIATNDQLLKMIHDLEKKSLQHDKEIQLIFETIKKMLLPLEGVHKKIGFKGS